MYSLLKSLLSQGIADEVDAETEEVLNEFSFLGAEEASSADKSEEWSYSGARADDVSLGELAQLTVNNDADINMDVSNGEVSKCFLSTSLSKIL